MPRKFGNEIRLPGTTGIDNFPPIKHRIRQLAYRVVAVPKRQIRQLASEKCSFLSGQQLATEASDTPADNSEVSPVV